MTLYVLSGLPGSGKTTRALELAEERLAILLCRDEIRVSYRSKIDECHLTQVIAAQAQYLLRAGYSVVVDCWNLTQGDEDLWYGLAADCHIDIQWIHLDTPVDICVSRDALRPQSIGADCVRGAASEFAVRLEQLSVVRLDT